MISRSNALALFAIGILVSGCFSYSFTGGSIPPEVQTIYIPFFTDKSGSGIAEMPSTLNDILIDRFVNQSRLKLANSEIDADVILDGSISTYRSAPFSISGEETAQFNRVEISIRATYKYATEPQPEWTKSINGFAEFDPGAQGIEGEFAAMRTALGQIADKMFQESVAKW